jgi:hypothetical protein
MSRERQMSWVANTPSNFVGHVVGNGQCVAYVQRAYRAPHTSKWRRGIWVKGNAVLQGTAIATFDPDGITATISVGRTRRFLHDQLANGLLVWDQWVGHPVAQRLIHFREGSGLPVER